MKSSLKSRCPKLSAPILSFMGFMIAPLAVPAASAATPMKIKKASAKEVYAATDASEMGSEQAGFAAPAEAEPAVLAAPASPAAQAASAPAAKTRQAVKAQAAPVASEKSSKKVAATFDAVPASQSDAILQRLQIVENLVRKYGRAYDYRTHTLRELELIQSTLDSAKASAPAAAPRTVVAPAAAPIPTTPAAAAVAAPATAPRTASDSIRTGQAAAIENAEDTNLSALPQPEEFNSNASDTTADQEN